MIKKDLSVIALTFFITRCFFNFSSFTNIYTFLITSGIVFIILISLKKLNLNLFSNKITKVIYFLIIFSIFLMIIINATLFINTNYFRYNNSLVVVLSLLVISYIIGKDHIKSIASISEIFLFVFIIISVLAYIGLLSLIKINNYQSFISFSKISIHIVPILIIFILAYLKDHNIYTGYLLGIVSCLIDLILLVGCLGTKLIKTYKFPGISVLKSLNLFHFINHLDKLFSFIYLFEYTITLAFSLYILKEILKNSNITKKESK